MAQPVWILSVDLQTKTATFQSGLSDAAKGARSAFTDIKSGSGEMGRAVSGNMGEARHSVMMLGEEFGVHIPRALTSFIASIGPIGAALEAAFPFLAIAVGATLLIEHLAAMREAGLKLTDDQIKFGTAASNAFNTLDEKLIQAKIRADELRNDHLGALQLQLELIDKQSMKELVHSFDEVAQHADVVMKELEGHWYTFGKGSDGAKHALGDFRTQYASLQAQGDSEGASGLLHGTLKQAQTIFDLQKQYVASQSHDGAGGDYQKFEEAAAGLKKMGVSISGVDAGIQGEIASQRQFLDVLNEGVRLERVAADLRKEDRGNAKTATGNAAAGQAAAGKREAAESQARMGEQAVAADRAVANAQLAIQRASVQQRLDVDLDFAAREYQLHLVGNQQEIAALNKSGPDYNNQLKALKDKALELTQAHDSQVIELTAKASVEANAKELRDLEQGERAKIEAATKASGERLAALDAAIKLEQSKNLQDTSFYRELLNQRIEAVRQMTEEENKLKEEAGKEDALNIQKLGELGLAAMRQADALEDSARRVSAAKKTMEETAIANADYQLKVQAYARELSALDKSGKDYANKQKAIQDKESQALKQHENELTAIKDKAEQERNQRILSAERQATEQIATGLTQSIMGHKTWASMITSFGDQAVQGMIKNSLMILMQQDKDKLGDAKDAAASAYAAGVKYGGPAGPVLGPVFGAAAFAGVMAFEGGGTVPGVGRGDIVPAMLEPGEGIVPKGVMAGLSDLAKSGGMGGGSTHYTINAPIHMSASALDADGVDKVFTKHADKIQRHFENTLRKMNR